MGQTIPIDDAIVRGITLCMPSSIIDEWYRQVSGSTRVNATDLRQIPCSSIEQLILLASRVKVTDNLNHDTIDKEVERILDE